MPDPDELAEMVKAIIEWNGGCLTGLSFDTKTGAHEYDVIKGQDMSSAVGKAVLMPRKS